VDANHYEIMAHPGALRAIDEFLERPAVALPDSSGRPQTADERRAVSA